MTIGCMYLVRPSDQSLCSFPIITQSFDHVTYQPGQVPPKDERAANNMFRQKSALGVLNIERDWLYLDQATDRSPILPGFLLRPMYMAQMHTHVTCKF